MKPQASHRPERPTCQCPVELKELAETLKHPKIIRTGLTSTEDGKWALYVSVPKDVDVPLEDLDSKSFPVIYVAEPDEPMRAQTKPNET